MFFNWIDNEMLDEVNRWEEEEETPDLGTCCACRQEGKTVRNIMMLARETPVPGTGWGCVQCHLPENGAVAIICDACLESGASYHDFVYGELQAKQRKPFAELSQQPTFDHNSLFHPELSTLQMAHARRMPNFYREPLGLPLNWQDETSGELPAAMMTLVDHLAYADKPAPTAQQLRLVVEYFQYHINAPCWKDIEHLRQRALKLDSVEAVSSYIDECLAVGLDPL